MTTPCACGPTSSEVRSGHAPAARPEWVPWIVAPLVFVSFWVIEAALHAVVFATGVSPLAGLLRPDTHELWMRAVIAAMFGAVAVLWNRAIRERNDRIAEMERHQARLRQMGAGLSLEDENERKVLAERLHEQTAQSLSAALLYLASVQPADEAERESLAAAIRLLDEAVADCREVAQQLSPLALEQFGLTSALEEAARRLARSTGTKIEVLGDDDVRFEHDVLHMAYAVSVDLLEQAARVPHTSVVRVRTHRGERRLGVELESASACEVDLFAAVELMAHVGGRVECVADGGGARIIVSAPAAA